LQDVVDHSEVLIIGKKDEEFRKIVEANGRPNAPKLIDLVRLTEREDKQENYQGICW
jgi:hypothetical protein